MVTSEEIGSIVARLVIHDEAFALSMLQAAYDAGERLLPDDVEKLSSWVNIMRILRTSIEQGISKEKR